MHALHSWMFNCRCQYRTQSRLSESKNSCSALLLVLGERGSAHLHQLIESCVESQVQHLIRSTGRQELEGQRSVLTSQYRRLVSTCIVRAQAQCLLSRLRVISPAAREAALRREMATRRERELRKEKRAQWMASPGWARRGNCHTLFYS